MARYSVNNSMGGTQQALSATYKTLVGYNSSATVRRTRCYEAMFGCTGTAADNTIEFDISRMTAAGTATSITPIPLDQADAAALSAAFANYTAEPTVTGASSLLYYGQNMRATIRWVAAPGSELVTPATNAAGLVLRARSAAYTSTASGTLMFIEE